MKGNKADLTGYNTSINHQNKVFFERIEIDNIESKEKSSNDTTTRQQPKESLNSDKKNKKDQVPEGKDKAKNNLSSSTSTNESKTKGSNDKKVDSGSDLSNKGDSSQQ